MSCVEVAPSSRHTAGFSRRVPAAFLLFALACSGPTDIVGVIDGVEPSAGDDPASDATAATALDPSATPGGEAAGGDEVALLLAGSPVADWPGMALEWPLSTPLAELFAGEPLDDDRARLTPAPWPSRRVAAGFARTPARGSSDVGARSPDIDARLLILDEDDARRLLALMTPAAGSGAERVGVFRDQLGDVYRVSVESEEMSLDPTGCGRMRREPFECAEHGPFD